MLDWERDRPHRARSLVQEVQRGGSPWGYGEHRVVFGVGRARSVDDVEVRWPSGYVQRVGAQTAGRELVISEPDLLHVSPATAAVGATVTVTARPARPDASPMGPGHRVELTMHPGAVALAVTDVGDGTYTAPATLPAAGVYAFTARVDGTAWRARPQAMAR